ncbi:hypothetical protein BRETT_004709 [Brettanomyces bruxellensis]|uniref:Zn(2)-C6 fungal-type domain-containing protein n=1 Tax=Dekkera bruxellensis TaxID=5007 RepID=A0A871RBW4_DEKBR|nr:uncharacterized protein BRETT_004709 [Brettanomyces bruxellensis]QOU20061.1 hypothetical protein BRETT_004709 [Brettanomyces bruxellensis]
MSYKRSASEGVSGREMDVGEKEEEMKGIEMGKAGNMNSVRENVNSVKENVNAVRDNMNTADGENIDSTVKENMDKARENANHPQSSLRKKRVGKACDSCRLKKTKCSGKQPCEKCIADNKICIYTQRKKSRDKTYSYEYVEMMEKRLCILRKSLLRLCELVRRSGGAQGSESGESADCAPADADAHGAIHDLERFRQRMTYDKDAENGPFSINQVVSLLISSEELKHDLNDEDEFFRRIGAAEEMFQKLKKQKGRVRHGTRQKSRAGSLQTHKKRQRKSAKALVSDAAAAQPSETSGKTEKTTKTGNAMPIPRPRAASDHEHERRIRRSGAGRAPISSSAPAITSSNVSLAFSGSNGSSSNSLSDSVSSPSPDSLLSESAFPYQAVGPTYMQPLRRIREEAGAASMDDMIEGRGAGASAGAPGAGVMDTGAIDAGADMIDLDSFALPGFNSGAQFAAAAMNGYFSAGAGAGNSSRSSNSSGISDNTAGIGAPRSALSSSTSITLNELGGVTPASSFDNFKIPSRLPQHRPRSSDRSLTELPSPRSNSSSKLEKSLFGSAPGMTNGENNASFFDSLVSTDSPPNMLRKLADPSMSGSQQPEYLLPVNRDDDFLRMQDRSRSIGSELDVL